MKGPNDPVTRADKRGKRVHPRLARRELPGIPIVAERATRRHSRASRTQARRSSSIPVDGTRDFIAKNGEFCVDDRARRGREGDGRRRAVPRVRGSAAHLRSCRGHRLVPHRRRRLAHAARRLERDGPSRACAAPSRGFHRSRNVDAKLSSSAARSSFPVGSSGIKECSSRRRARALRASLPRGKVKLWDAVPPDAIVRMAAVSSPTRRESASTTGARRAGTRDALGQRGAPRGALRKFASNDRRRRRDDRVRDHAESS